MKLRLETALLAIVILLLVATSASIFTGIYARHDTELLNGTVISKDKEQVSCEHSYNCNCTTSNNTTTCSICWEHFHDYNWNVRSNVGSILIDRENRQGTIEPSRFKTVRIGEPFALEHDFVNYIKANPSSLFNNTENQTLIEKFKKKLPEYPGRVYDYYRADHAINVGVSLSPEELKLWNKEISDTLKTLGPKKQANMIVVLTSETDPMFAQSLNAYWLGGKKNDIITVIGTTQYPKIEWVTVLSWSDSEILKVKLRDALLDTGEANPTETVSLISTHILTHFVRKPMKDFEYLKEIDTSSIILGILTLLFGLLWWRESVRTKYMV